MGRNKALAIAGAVAISAMTAALAIGANFGLFGLASAGSANLGNFTADPVAQSAPAPDAAAGDTTTAPATDQAPEVVYIDEPVPAPVTLFAEPQPAPEIAAPAATQPAPVASAPASASDDDHVDDHGRNRGRGGDVEDQEDVDDDPDEDDDIDDDD